MRENTNSDSEDGTVDDYEQSQKNCRSDVCDTVIKSSANQDSNPKGSDSQLDGENSIENGKLKKVEKLQDIEATGGIIVKAIKRENEIKSDLSQTKS